MWWPQCHPLGGISQAAHLEATPRGEGHPHHLVMGGGPHKRGAQGPQRSGKWWEEGRGGGMVGTTPKERRKDTTSQRCLPWEKVQEARGGNMEVRRESTR